MGIELGLYSFGERTPDPQTGRTISAEDRVRRLLEEIELADRLGLDVFGLGEHHREEFVVSAPAVLLAAAAARTKRIRLTSAVNVISSDDPVRVFQQFAMLDLISGGRAEVMAGRGSFTESFPLFGYDLKDYDELFEEKLDLFSALLDRQPVTWSGTTRAPLRDQLVYPATASRLKTWVGVGGNPQSVVRAARHGFPLVLAIIGGDPLRFRSYADLYRQSLERFGKSALPVAVHSPGHIAATDEDATPRLDPAPERCCVAFDPGATSRRGS